MFKISETFTFKGPRPYFVVYQTVITRAGRCPSLAYLAIKGSKTSDQGQIPTFSITFPSTSFQVVDVTLLPLACLASALHPQTWLTITKLT